MMDKMALRVEDIQFGFGPDPVLKGVTLEVPRGTVCAVVGPNGSGKSTLLKTISGYLRPWKGHVKIGGVDVHAASFSHRSRLVTYCGDEGSPSFAFSVKETVLLGSYAGPDDPAKDLMAAEQAMKTADVWDLRDRPVTELSSGERQRVFLARAICQDPEVFLLDEPTAHLDMAYELMVMELVSLMASRGKTFLTVVHDLNLALRYASKVFFMKEGRVVGVSAPDDVTTETVLSVYGVEALVAKYDDLRNPIVVPVSRPGRMPS